MQCFSCVQTKTNGYLKTSAPIKINKVWGPDSRALQAHADIVLEIALKCFCTEKWHKIRGSFFDIGSETVMVGSVLFAQNKKVRLCLVSRVIKFQRFGFYGSLDINSVDRQLSTNHGFGVLIVHVYHDKWLLKKQTVCYWPGEGNSSFVTSLVTLASACYLQRQTSSAEIHVLSGKHICKLGVYPSADRREHSCFHCLHLLKLHYS